MAGVAVAEALREFLHGAEGVEPEGLDFDGLAAARGDDPVVNFDVHPGELDAGGVGDEEAVGVHVDAVAGSRSCQAMISVSVA